MSRKLYEKTIMNLLNIRNNKHRGKRYYAHLLGCFRKSFTDKVPTAGVNITDKINLYINPVFFESLSDDQRVELLEHECEHIMRFHQKRLKNLDSSDFKMWNIACDAPINAPLTTLHHDGVTVEKLRKEIPDLEHNQSSEYYFEKLKQYRDENGGKGGEGEKTLCDMGETDDHSTWGKNDELDGENTANEVEGQIDEISKEIVKKAMRDSIEKCNGRGNVPVHILKHFEDLNQSTVNWRQQLKQFFARADKFNKIPTRKKLNRRYKHLNAGRRKDPQTHIAVGIDNSGSVNDALFNQFFSEIKSAYNLGGIKFTIIQADCEVNSEEEYTSKSKIKRTGNGGTSYMPAINRAKELKVDGMIYFGDGDIFGEVLTKPKFPFLWAIEEGRDAPVEWGKMCQVKVEKNRGN